MNIKKIIFASFSVQLFSFGILLFSVNAPKSVCGSLSRTKITTSPLYASFGVDIPSDYELHGIDVSRHQRNIDWDAVSKMTHNDIGISFAFIKASEGRSIADQYFEENWKEAKNNGIIRGAYHFYRPHLTAEEQASLFFKQVPRLYKGDLPPVLDIEMKGRCPAVKLKKNLKKWLVLVEKHYGMTPILYTNYGFYKNLLTGKEFKKYPLWIAHYKTPDINAIVNEWHFWQHTDHAHVNGIRGGVDFNVFNGNIEDLKELCKK